MQTREYWLSKRFTDDKKYPYGFSRCGDFTIVQSATLENYGMLMRALVDAQVLDPTEEDLMLQQKLLQGLVDCELSSVWFKYTNLKHSKISVSSSKPNEEITLIAESITDDDFDD